MPYSVTGCCEVGKHSSSLLSRKAILDALCQQGWLIYGRSQCWKSACSCGSNDSTIDSTWAYTSLSRILKGTHSWRAQSCVPRSSREGRCCDRGSFPRTRLFGSWWSWLTLAKARYGLVPTFHRLEEKLAAPFTAKFWASWVI